VITSTLLGACSNPTAYQVNPKPDQTEENQEVPESQQEGYMRIIGDLRWDKFVSVSDWDRDFPKCISGKVLETDQIVIYIDENCATLRIGGINIRVDDVVLERNSGTKSGWMTSKVYFTFNDISQYRAFEAAIKEKYEISLEESEKAEAPVYCSKYTCWELKSRRQRATATSYAVSLLDKVKVNSSEF